MKRLFKGMVAVVLLFSMSTSVFAAETETSPKKIDADLQEALGSITGTSQDVTIKVENAKEAETKYRVDITWSDLTFTYTFNNAEGNIVWDPETHSYKLGETTGEVGSWDKTKATINVENHSNAPVEVATAFASGKDSTTKNGVTAQIVGSTPNGNAIAEDIASGSTSSSSDGSLTTTTSKDRTDYVLSTAVGTEVTNAPKVENVVTISGVPIVDTSTDKFILDTITVTLTKK